MNPFVRSGMNLHFATNYFSDDRWRWPFLPVKTYLNTGIICIVHKVNLQVFNELRAFAALPCRSNTSLRNVRQTSKRIVQHCPTLLEQKWIDQLTNTHFMHARFWAHPAQPFKHRHHMCLSLMSLTNSGKGLIAVERFIPSFSAIAFHKPPNQAFLERLYSMYLSVLFTWFHLSMIFKWPLLKSLLDFPHGGICWDSDLKAAASFSWKM